MAPRGRRPLARHLRQLRLGLKTLLTLASGAVPGRRRRLRELLGARVKRITVKPFMDIHTMLEERLTQCCVRVGTRSRDQDQCAPFCAVQAGRRWLRRSWPSGGGSRSPRDRRKIRSAPLPE